VLFQMFLFKCAFIQIYVSLKYECFCVFKCEIVQRPWTTKPVVSGTGIFLAIAND